MELATWRGDTEGLSGSFDPDVDPMSGVSIIFSIKVDQDSSFEFGVADDPEDGAEGQSVASRDADAAQVSFGGNPRIVVCLALLGIIAGEEGLLGGDRLTMAENLQPGVSVLVRFADLDRVRQWQRGKTAIVQLTRCQRRSFRRQTGIRWSKILDGIDCSVSCAVLGLCHWDECRG